MEKIEFAKLAAAIKELYPNSNILQTAEGTEVWFRLLEDLPFDVANTAVIKYAMTNKYPPTVADIRETSASVRLGDLPNWEEGWQQVRNAIRNFGYMRPEEAYQIMDEVTLECVKCIGWLEICSSENPDTIRAQFRQMYENKARRKKEDAKFPEGFKIGIEQLRQKMLEG